ncbi:MAG: nucleotidyltransferase domain-containing protein [Chloroflexi bacterium]|nr:nucleotidyltransferase domain-containing protein [Chloroflexota bacterium]
MKKGIETLFAGKALVSLLKVFLFNPDRSFYQREIVNMTKEALRNVQLELDRLISVGLITRTISGNRVYYQLDPRCSIAHDLKSIFLKTVFVDETLGENLSPIRDKINIAFIYGSIARGEEKSHSDLDLIIIGSLGAREAARLLAPAKKKLAREINLVIYNPLEFRKKYSEGNHFINAVLSEPKIFLIGDEDELTKILK